MSPSPSTAAAEPVRRTQAERSAATTAKLLDATLAVLAERGYHGATTSLIAERAGVSRGAMLHHFPNRAALIVASAQAVLDAEVEAFRSAMAAIPEGADRYHAAIDFLWAAFQSDAHVAWTEVQLGARTDPDVSEAVSGFGRTIHSRIAETWIETFPEAADFDAGELAPDFATALLERLAQRKLTGSLSVEQAQDLVDALKGLSTLFLAPQGDIR